MRPIITVTDHMREQGVTSTRVKTVALFGIPLFRRDESYAGERQKNRAVGFTDMGNIMAMLRDSKYKPAILAQVNPDSEVYQICDFLWAEIEKWHEKHGEDGQQQSDRDTERL